MKIAFDSQIFTLQEYGGVSRYICSLATHLAEMEGVETRIITPFYINAYLGNLPKHLVSGINIPKIPKTGRIFHHAGLWLARRAIAKFSPEIVHESYYSASSHVSQKSRIVVTVYDMIHERFSSVFSLRDRTSEWKRIATQRADHVICISESTRKDLLELFDLPENKVSVVYLGFDKLPAVDLKPNNNNKPYLLYVGQRESYKNFAGFLRAYATSSWLCNNFNVLCFGGGVFSNEEKTLFNELKLTADQVLQLNGSDGKLADAYQHAALFVYPSFYEGFGIPPLEAMSLSCPVACSDNSSIPEVVGNAAEYFDANNIDSICIAMERVLNSTERRTELINNGFMRCTQFSWARCAQETHAVYKSLL